MTPEEYIMQSSGIINHWKPYFGAPVIQSMGAGQLGQQFLGSACRLDDLVRRKQNRLEGGSAMKNCVRSLIILVAFSAGVQSALAVWKTEICSDGRIVALAPGGTGYCGTDGRTVSVPDGWKMEKGPDGRLIAIPPEGSSKRGIDGRAVAIPKGWSFKVGQDGRGVAIPPGGTATQGKDKRMVAVPEGWTRVEGIDKRATAIPPDGTTEAGPDGRIIAVPKGWTTTVGPDGRMVAIPPGGEFIVGTDQFATVLPPDNFDVTDYVTRYCILGPQTDTPIEEEKEEAAVATGATE
jgi:hypothetical protein